MKGRKKKQEESEEEEEEKAVEECQEKVYNPVERLSVSLFYFKNIILGDGYKFRRHSKII
jgi:hypothetical protein